MSHRSLSIFAIIAAVPATAWADAPRVITDFGPTHSIVAQVMNGVGTPDVLLAPGDDPHDFTLRPSQARTLSNADLVVWVGEALTPVALPQHHVLLLFPECSIPTVDVFKNKGLKRDRKPIPSQEVAEARHWINDCLPVVLANYPRVNHVYQALSQYFHVYLSGTGSTLFILFDDLDAARKAKINAK